MDEIVIAFAVLSVAFLVILVLLYRRFRRALPDVPAVCHAAAALALTFGIGNVITGTAHSVAVTSLALREPEYGPLQILRFTTGAMHRVHGRDGAPHSGLGAQELPARPGAVMGLF